MGKTTRTTLTALTAATLLTACGGGGSADPTGEATSSSASSSPSGGEQSDTAGADESSELDEAAAEAGIDPANPPEPIASVTMPGTGLASKVKTDITIDLLSLRRDGDVLVLNLGFTPEEGESTSYYGWTTTTWSPQIIDTTNLTVHEVVSSAEGSLQTNTGATGIRVGGGQTLHLYAVFAAPPQDVETVTVKPADGAPAFTGVTIQ